MIKIFKQTVFNLKLYLPKFSPNVYRNYSQLKKIPKFSSNFKNRVICRNNLFSTREVMKLSSVIKVIEEIAPRYLAEKWDNTGLLIEPENPFPISTVFLTNDLTEEVMTEAVEAKANLIISYHPPIFSAIKGFACKNWKDRVIMKCIANNIALYSPHTACDAVEGGVNDWLIRCFDLTDVRPIHPFAEKDGLVIEIIKPEPVDLNQVLGSEIQFETKVFSESVSVFIKADVLDEVLKKFKEVPNLQIISIIQCRSLAVDPLRGIGRIGKLAKPLKLRTCIQLMKEHAQVNNIRVSIGAHNTLDTEISTIAACAGSGGSVLKGVPADLYVTGEMSHHDILDCHHKRTSIILCEHSNSERGYLNDLASQLRSKMQDVKIIISSVDKDPISIH